MAQALTDRRRCNRLEGPVGWASTSSVRYALDPAKLAR